MWYQWDGCLSRPITVRQGVGQGRYEGTTSPQQQRREHIGVHPTPDPDKTSREHDEVNQHQTLKEAIIELREEVKQMKYMLMMLMICVSLCLAVFAMSPKMRDVANRNRIEVNFDLAG